MKPGIVILLSLLVILIVATGAALAASSYSDPPGDHGELDGTQAPDVTAAEVANTLDRVSFRVTIGNHQTLPPRSLVGLILDADKKAFTGSPDGIDARAIYVSDLVGEETLFFERYSRAAGDYVQVPTTNMSASFSSGVLSVSMPRSALLDTRGFAFATATVLVNVDGSRSAGDVAPDGDAFWTYDLQGVPRATETFFASTPAGTPSRPVAGKRFTVSTLVTRSDRVTFVTSSTVDCTVRIGRSKIKARGKMVSPTARCVMTIPRGAKGKVLQGSITVRSDEGSVKRTFRFKVV